MNAATRRSAVCVLATLLLCAAASPSAAQEQLTEFQPYRIPGWTFTPGVIVGASADSNVAIASPDVNRKTASDQLLQIAPFGDLSYLSPRVSFAGGYRGTMQRYLDFNNLDGTDHRGYFLLRERLTRRLTLFASDNYAQVPTTDRLELNGLPFQRTGARYNSLAGGIESRLSKSLDAVVRYEMTWVDFVRKDTNLIGGMVNGLHGQLTHRFTERASAGAEYGVRLADLNEGTKHLAFHDAGGVFHYRVAETLFFETSGGLAYLVDRTTDTTKTGPYVKADLTRKTERATLGLGASRSYVPSMAFGGTNQSQEVRGYLQMPLMRGNRLYVQESASWRRTDPFVKTELPLDSIFLHSLVGYTVQRWLRAEAYYQFTTQDNQTAGGQISRHVGGLQFIVAEPMRIR